MQAGEFHLKILRKSRNIKFPEILSRHPDAESITARYQDQGGNDIVEVHYYALPNGSVIPGKRPDPKLLFEDGVLYHQEKPKDYEARVKKQALDPAWRRWLRRLRKWLTCHEEGVLSPR